MSHGAHHRLMSVPQIRRRVPMFKSIIRFATRRPKTVIALWAVIAFALASLSGLYGYKVVTDDLAQFLPKGSESAQAIQYAQAQFGQQKGTHTVTVLVKRADGRPLSAGDRAEVKRLVAALPTWRLDHHAQAVKGQPGDLDERAGEIVAAQVGPVAKDGRSQLAGLAWKGNVTDPVAQEHFLQVRDRAAAQADDLR